MPEPQPDVPRDIKEGEKDRLLVVPVTLKGEGLKAHHARSTPGELDTCMLPPPSMRDAEKQHIQ